MADEQILIVDDNPINLKLAQILLTNEGYDVSTAPDAEEALALLLDHLHPDLMLVDIQLPGMDGLELTRRVKANPGTRDIVVVALTAFAMKGDEQRAREHGCDGYITKPIDTRSLPIRLREYLSRRAPQAESRRPKTSTFGGPEVEGLRRRFLAEGLEQSRNLLHSLPCALDPVSAGQLMHQWIGAAGLLGHRNVSNLTREIEQSLKERPLDIAQLRESLSDLVYAFTDQPQATQIGMPNAIGQTL